jgi:hypothetical protein
MGCGMSTEEKEGKARNEEIENQLKRDKMMQRNEIKMLLLGTSLPFFRRHHHRRSLFGFPTTTAAAVAAVLPGLFSLQPF